MPATDKWTRYGDSLLLSGADDAAISRELGVTRTTVAYHRKRLGLPPAQRPGTKPQRGEAADRRVTIRLTPEEHEAMTRAAGGEPLSAWGRGVMRRAAGMDPLHAAR